MKKFLLLLIASIMVFATSSAAFAGTSTEPASGDFVAWGYYEANPNFSVSVSGSLQEGDTYTVSGSGNCGAALNGYAFMDREGAVLTNAEQGGAWLNGSLWAYSSIDPSFTLTSGPLTAGAAGTSAYYAVFAPCIFRDGGHFLRSEIIKVTFERRLGTPTNFAVIPQSATSAFTTWGVATGASSYTVTAAPGGAHCTTTDNFCTITGLTSGETYTFTLVASNDTSSTSVGSGPVLMRQPVNVAVALSGGTWKVGETVTAQVAVQGQGGVAITWYRCDQVVGAMPTAPVGCSSVASGTSTSYTLTSADVGKYITAHVFVNNTDPQGQMTASNNNVVLASNAVAPAPVADPGGKPTIVNIPDRIVPVTGGTEIVITGTGLAGVTSVTIGGVPTDVVSKTDTSITVKVPVSGKTGAADVVITNAKGSVTEKGALVYTTAPVTKITKTKTVTGFTATQKTLTAAQKTAVKTLISANPTLTQLTCEAKTTGVAVKAAELTKAKALATATCAYATTVKKTLLVGVSASQSQPKAKASRSVLLTLKN